MVLARAVLAVIPMVQKRVKGVEANLIQKRDTAITPIKNLRVVAANPIRMEKATTVPRGAIVMAIRSPRVVEASPTRMEKAATVPRGAIVMAIRSPKAVEASPTHMEKAAMATRAVMENLIATKKHQPTEGMEGMVQVLSNT